MTNVENRAVSWIRLSDYQILTNGLTTFTRDKRFNLLHSAGTSEWTLELVSVTEKDEGGYQCQVRLSSHHNSMITEVVLNVFKRLWKCSHSERLVG